ncbi:MAG: HEAT repeat domain-containing protein, partial [Deltaproteobacteria bacterium]|nr:HEAT repeat domain-containing protein [Deltaproteobacteria bacterium]
MENANIAYYCGLKIYIRLGIIFLFLFFPLMSCKGKSGEKADASHIEGINIENTIRDLETGDIETSKKAAAALGKSENPEAMDALLVALEEYEDSGVRKAAALALGTLGEPDCTDRVVNALVEEDSTEVRDAICKALQEFEGFSIEPILYLVRD